VINAGDVPALRQIAGDAELFLNRLLTVLDLFDPPRHDLSMARAYVPVEIGRT